MNLSAACHCAAVWRVDPYTFLQATLRSGRRIVSLFELHQIRREV